MDREFHIGDRVELSYARDGLRGTVISERMTSFRDRPIPPDWEGYHEIKWDDGVIGYAYKSSVRLVGPLDLMAEIV
jgi:hypothetical protein